MIGFSPIDVDAEGGYPRFDGGKWKDEVLPYASRPSPSPPTL
jgi:hypothetical protein